MLANQRTPSLHVCSVPWRGDVFFYLSQGNLREFRGLETGGHVPRRFDGTAQGLLLHRVRGRESGGRGSEGHERLRARGPRHQGMFVYALHSLLCTQTGIVAVAGLFGVVFISVILRLFLYLWYFGILSVVVTYIVPDRT